MAELTVEFLETHTPPARDVSLLLERVCRESRTEHEALFTRGKAFFVMVLSASHERSDARATDSRVLSISSEIPPHLNESECALKLWQIETSVVKKSILLIVN